VLDVFTGKAEPTLAGSFHLRVRIEGQVGGGADVDDLLALGRIGEEEDAGFFVRVGQVAELVEDGSRYWWRWGMAW
jgi:hypothetical protein